MTQKELLQLIDRAAAEGWTKLDLSRKGLTEIPPETGQLTNLTTLDLSNNGLTSVPPEIWQLTNLTTLDLSYNQLTAVPPEIGQLTNLTVLNLNGDQLTTVPSEIGQLSNLTTLDFSDNQLTVVPPEIGQLSNLTTLSLNGNHLAAVPPEIGQLTNLTTLNLDGNQLTAVPPEIGQLTNLMTLDLSDNQLTAVPTTIGQLIKLTRLDLSNNRLMIVPTEIMQLINLTALYLSSNQLTAMPAVIGQLTKLTVLYLYNNRLTAVPPEIGQLTNLIRLDLGGNHLSAMPPEIGQLTNLTTLYLWRNLLTIFPAEIGQLVNLKALNLGDNQLMAIPTEIGQLIRLTELYFFDNLLTSVPTAIEQLTNLTRLHLSNNKLTALPATMQQLTKLAYLDLRDNSELGISEEVLAQIENPALILETYFAAQQRPLHEAKMLLVGQGGVGKTALARRLLHNLPPDENQGKTEGVAIYDLRLTIDDLRPNRQSSIRLNLWDFGGQGIYQATHQFFFTTRSLYLVVLNARTGERESRLHHWLKLVDSLSDHAPVIIVVNKQDEHPLELDERALKDKYRNVVDVVYTSCISGAGIDDLRHAIAQTLPYMPQLNARFPAHYFALKERLEQMEEEYIPYEEYARLCREVDIARPADQQSWVRILHELGVVLNYQEDRRVADTHVLNPNWVTDGVYQILSAPALTVGGGFFHESLLDEILDAARYPSYRHHFILGMMQKFELCFPIPGSAERYLTPDLLPPQQPDLNAVFPELSGGALAFQLRYEVLPGSVLSRFMVRMMHILDRQHSWRSGAILQWDGNRALVQADEEAATISIRVTGTEATRRSLLNSIRLQLAAIHHTFPGLQVTEYAPIPGHAGTAIAYADLLFYEEAGEFNPLFAPIRGRIDVRQLLAGIESPEMRRERQVQQWLLDGYTVEEMRQLCYDLNVPYEDLSQNKTALARGLVEYMARRGRLEELAGRVGRRRP